MKSFFAISVLFVLTILIFSGAACQQGENVKTYDIEIKNFAFNPVEIEVNAGDTLVWTNNDSVMHDITVDNGLFDHDINPEETFSYTFNTTGTYPYHCDIHQTMKGKIIVK